jgi:hypothetical protein
MIVHMTFHIETYIKLMVVSKKKEEVYLTYADALDFADKDINQN